MGPADLESVEVLKRAVDARRRVRFVFNLAVTVRPEAADRVATGAIKGVHVAPLKPRPALAPPEKTAPTSHPVVVVGAGPGGLLAAWHLGRAGLDVIVLERGAPVSERARDVQRFFRHGDLDPESNVLFGEGGAGTFSDGKLYTRTKDPRIRQVWELFVEMGAPADILVDAQPHIGTNKLRRLVPNLRRELERLGVEVRFHSRLDALEVSGGRLSGLRLADGTRLKTEHVILATGHSARDTYRALEEAGVQLEPMPYAIGVRIEHLQATIDRVQYGSAAGHPRLGAASYRLTHNGPSRSSYSFCMCPGGTIVASTHEPATVVTNGMSARGRSGHFANAGLVVTVRPEDYTPPGREPTGVAAIAFQKRWEARAFEVGGGGFHAPAQRASDFLKNVPTDDELKSTYLPGVRPANLADCLPEFATRALREALPHFQRKMPGFAGREAVLVAVESRVSAPVRIPRDADGQSVSVRGLYPVGEGAGFAGGITSAAVDGLEAAARLLENLAHG